MGLQSGFGDDVYKLLYGDNVDINSVKAIKSDSDIYHDLAMLLANNDITKYNDIRKLPATVFATEIENRIKTKKIKTKTINIPSVGFKN